MLSPAAGPSADELAELSCHSCGIYDASLRHSVHPAVVSMIVRASESARVGIWCAKCRGIESAKAAAISLLAGWWSLRGPKLTIAALRANLRGGEQKPSTNAQMLRGIAKLEYDRRNPEFASMFARAAHSVQPQRENSRLIDELNRGGYRSALPGSPWRFAPFVPVVIGAIALISVTFNLITGGEEQAPEEPAVAVAQRAGIVPPPPAPSKLDVFRSDHKRREDLSQKSAAELAKQLTSTYDKELARAYYRAELNEALTSIRGRIERGEELRTMQMSFAAMGTNPAVAPLLNENVALRSAHTNLMTVMNDATRYYRGGPTIESMQRTAGESFNVTVDIAFDAIVSDIRGHTERSGALATEVVARAASIEEMRRDVRIRAAVLSETTKAMQRCSDVLH